MKISGAGQRSTGKKTAARSASCDNLNYEAALVECAAGQRSGVGKIYAHERNRLREVAWRIVRNHERAEDVIHEAFAQILRDAKHFDPARGSARGWIYTIVRNTALKNAQNAGREIAVEDDSLIAMRDQQEVAQASSQIAESAFLRSCLEDLEPRRRASLILAIVDGRTHAEIASHLGVPVGTVKAWIRRELISLRERLKG